MSQPERIKYNRLREQRMADARVYQRADYSEHVLDYYCRLVDGYAAMLMMLGKDCRYMRIPYKPTRTGCGTSQTNPGRLEECGFLVNMLGPYWHPRFQGWPPDER